MKVVETLVPMISKTEDWMSASVILLICPFLTFLFHICRGFALKHWSDNERRGVIQIWFLSQYGRKEDVNILPNGVEN